MPFAPQFPINLCVKREKNGLGGQEASKAGTGAKTNLSWIFQGASVTLLKLIHFLGEANLMHHCF